MAEVSKPGSEGSAPVEQGPILNPRIPFQKETTTEFAVGTLKMVALLLAFGVTLVFSVIYGWTIYESYFKLPEEVEVPVVTGKNIEEANEILAQVGLKLQVHESRYTNKVPEKVIISQNPAGKRRVRKDNEILVVVSLGPELVEVPELTGLSLREAEIDLANAALVLGKVTWTEPDPEKAEEVLRQNPKSGKKVKKGTPINLHIQKGGGGQALTPVPGLVGKSLYAIEDVLTKADLRLGGVTWKFHQVAPRGEILSQGPPSGARVSTHTEVEVEVSAGPPEARAFKQRRLSIQVPGGSHTQRVSVLLNNGLGTDTVFDGTPGAGDRMDLMVSGLPGSELEIYVNEKLQKREKL
ncbi:MAG: PASTA domain-containing protein [Candidatus Eremiobacterota bacterium]